MATYYAMSTLTTWVVNASGGWSLSSGGADSGAFPGSADNVIFDNLSGSARTITISNVGGGPQCNNLTANTCAAMVFSAPTGGVVFVNGNADFTNITSTAEVALTGGTSSTLIMGSCTFSPLKIQKSGAGTSVTLAGNTSPVNQSIVQMWSACTFNASTFSMGCYSFSGTLGTINMGSSFWYLNGTSGTVWQCTGGTVNCQTSSVRINDTSSGGTKIFSGGGQAYNGFWHAATGILQITDNNTFASFIILAGTVLELLASTVNVAASFTVDGTADVTGITIRTNTPGSQATLGKSGGGTVNFDRVKVRDIIGQSVVFNCRMSTNNGNNVNFTFSPYEANLLTFF